MHILSLVAIVALICAAFHWFRFLGGGRYLTLGLYCLILAIVSGIAVCERANARKHWIAMAFFAWAYLVFVLKGGFTVHAFSDVEEHSRAIELGVVLIVATGLISHLYFAVFGQKESDRKQSGTAASPPSEAITRS